MGWHFGIRPRGRRRPLNGYGDYFHGAGIGQMVWARDLFFVGDDPHISASGVVEVGGPVRLVFGPYMALPPGHWAATIVLAVSKVAADLTIASKSLAGARLTCLGRGPSPRGEGVCEVTIDFPVPELRISRLNSA